MITVVWTIFYLWLVLTILLAAMWFLRRQDLQRNQKSDDEALLAQSDADSDDSHKQDPAEAGAGKTDTAGTAKTGSDTSDSDDASSDGDSSDGNSQDDDSSAPDDKPKVDANASSPWKKNSPPKKKKSQSKKKSTKKTGSKSAKSDADAAASPESESKPASDSDKSVAAETEVDDAAEPDTTTESGTAAESDGQDEAASESSGPSATPEKKLSVAANDDVPEPTEPEPESEPEPEPEPAEAASTPTDATEPTADDDAPNVSGPDLEKMLEGIELPYNLQPVELSADAPVTHAVFLSDHRNAEEVGTAFADQLVDLGYEIEAAGFDQAVAKRNGDVLSMRIEADAGKSAESSRYPNAGIDDVAIEVWTGTGGPPDVTS